MTLNAGVDELLDIISLEKEDLVLIICIIYDI